MARYTAYMAQPSAIDIDITRGDDFTTTITFAQAVAGFSEIRFTAREQAATTETDNSGATLSVALTPAGTFTATLTLTSTQTRALQRTSYLYDIQTLTTGGLRNTTQRGFLHVTFDVGRS